MGSNHRHAAYEAAALTAELRRRGSLGTMLHSRPEKNAQQGFHLPLDESRQRGNNHGMKLAMARLLVLACSLQLTLPSGWCCRLPASELSQDADEQASNGKTCCACCPETSASHAQPDEESPSPPSPIKDCCCKPFQALLVKDSPKPPSPTLAFVEVPVVALQAGSNDNARMVAVDLHPRISLHLLNSVWLC